MCFTFVAEGSCLAPLLSPPPVCNHHQTWKAQTNLSNQPMKRGSQSAAWREAPPSPTSPSTWKVTLPLLVTKSFQCFLLHTTGMNHPLLASYALLPLLHLDSHLSILQNALKVHQDLLLHTSFLGSLLCVCFRGSPSKKCLPCSGITPVNQTCTKSRIEREGKTRKATEAQWDKELLI